MAFYFRSEAHSQYDIIELSRKENEHDKIQKASEKLRVTIRTL